MAKTKAKATRKIAARTGERKAKAAAVSKAKKIAPALSAQIGSTPKTRFRGNPDIFGRLVEDHDRHRALIAMIQESDAKSPERKRTFLEFAKEAKSHAAAEEQALWSTVLRDPATTDDGRHAVAEHKEIDDLLADLAARDSSGAGWLKRFEKLKEKYLHHIREEEQEQFVAAEKHLTAADVRHLRGVFNRRKRAERANVKVEKKLRPSLY
jgi:hypothetical protein